MSHRSMADIAGYGLGGVPPFSLNVDGELLVMEQVLRHLPGKRLAVRARWQGETVFAKLFFSADQHGAAREVARQEALCKANLPTPESLGLYSVDGGVLILNRWCEGVTGSEAMRGGAEEVVVSVLSTVFDLYEAGWFQRDLHLDNFLYDGNKVWIIDAGEIVSLPSSYRCQSTIIDNLGLLCAQAPLDLRDKLFERVSQKLRESGFSSVGLKVRMKRRSDRRMKAAMKKWRRESSAIEVRSDDRGRWLWDRNLSEHDRQHLEKAVLEPEKMPTIKLGSRVAVHGDSDWVVKHYREASIKTRFKHWWFLGRADVSWVMGWTWSLLGVPTPKPVMLLRKKNGQALIVFPRWPGVQLSHLMEKDVSRAEQVAPEAVLWLERLHRAGFWHGDTKAQNVLVSDDDHACWIDLDGAGFSRCGWLRKRRACKELLRFQENWSQFSGGGSSKSQPPVPGGSKDNSSSANRE